MTDAEYDAHNRRLRALDRFLPAAQPLPEPEPDEPHMPLSVPGGVGVATMTRVDPADYGAVWNATELHILAAHVADVDSLDRLLDAWEPRIAEHATPAGDDSQALITWPTRDTAAMRTLINHGFTPGTAFAIRPAGLPTPPATTTATIRPATAEDIPAATRMWLDQVAWDNRFLGNPMRDAAPEHFRGFLEKGLETGALIWVAEDAGELVGLLKFDPPEHTEWLRRLVEVPTAYLEVMYVAPTHRGVGLGAAMLAHAHDALDTAGFTTRSLHYSTLNPLSGPFWHRFGYRPLWTQWTRRPAMRKN